MSPVGVVALSQLVLVGATKEGTARPRSCASAGPSLALLLWAKGVSHCHGLGLLQG